MKASDDGGAMSAAGVPMLEVLKKENLTDTLVIVIYGILVGLSLVVGGAQSVPMVKVPRGCFSQSNSYLSKTLLHLVPQWSILMVGLAI